ncbi:MAG: hypothetical protein AAFS07_03665 [Pseudomonadota bacterium]
MPSSIRTQGEANVDLEDADTDAQPPKVFRRFQTSSTGADLAVAAQSGCQSRKAQRRNTEHGSSADEAALC